MEYVLLTTNIPHACRQIGVRRESVSSYYKNTTNALRALHPSAVLMAEN